VLRDGSRAELGQTVGGDESRTPAWSCLFALRSLQLQPGRYALTIEVADLITGKNLELKDAFEP
jgi:hypothetical protein